MPGTYFEYINQDHTNYDLSMDDNGYSDKDVNHVTNLCHAKCDGDVCVYHMKVNLFASEYGAITFEECKDVGLFPTITMEFGKTYKFVQADISNYMHPIMGLGTILMQDQMKLMPQMLLWALTIHALMMNHALQLIKN